MLRLVAVHKGHRDPLEVEALLQERNLGLGAEHGEWAGVEANGAHGAAPDYTTMTSVLSLDGSAHSIDIPQDLALSRPARSETPTETRRRSGNQRRYCKGGQPIVGGHAAISRSSCRCLAK